MMVLWYTYHITEHTTWELVVGKYYFLITVGQGLIRNLYFLFLPKLVLHVYHAGLNILYNFHILQCALFEVMIK